MKLGCNIAYLVFMLTFLSAVTSVTLKSLWSYVMSYAIPQNCSYSKKFWKIFTLYSFSGLRALLD